MANVSVVAAYLTLGDTYPVLGNLVMPWLAQVDGMLRECQCLVNKLANIVPAAIYYLSGGKSMLNILLCSATLVTLAIARYLRMPPPPPTKTLKYMDQSVQTDTPDCSSVAQIPTMGSIEEEVYDARDDTHQNSETPTSPSEDAQVQSLIPSTAHVEAQDSIVSSSSTLPEDPPLPLPLPIVSMPPSVSAIQEVDEQPSSSAIPALSEIDTPASPQACVPCDIETPSETATTSESDATKIDGIIPVTDGSTQNKSEDLKPQIDHEKEQKPQAEPVTELITASTNTSANSYCANVVLREQPPMRPILMPILKPLPSRGVDFMHSTEIIDLTDPKPDSVHIALSDQTNSNVQPIDGHASRLQSKIRAHTAGQPDWAIAPSEEGSEQLGGPLARGTARNGRPARGRRGKKRSTIDSPAAHV